MTLLQYFQLIAYALAIISSFLILYTTISNIIKNHKQKRHERTIYNVSDKRKYYTNMLNDPRSTYREKKRAKEKLSQLKPRAKRS